MGQQQFTVIMATYAGDNPEQLYEAAASIFEQTCPPEELVLVFDGPVPESHESVYARMSALGTVHPLRLDCSIGPGGARHHGILAAAHDVVAVMDADDLCLPTRFEKQLAVLEAGEADVVGAWIREFEQTPGDRDVVRKVPERHEDVCSYAKRRSPMNNVTVMFRKQAYLESGGYRQYRVLEDYDLFSRMIMQGARFRNIPEVLVDVRCGQQMFKRRGWVMIQIELTVLYQMYRSGFFTVAEFVSNVVVRTTARLMPIWMRRAIYQKMLRSRSSTTSAANVST
jgi:glycosyltransferase involved in cell wall biosynthesis